MFHTKKEFASLVGKPTNELSVHISRGKVIVHTDGLLIDDENFKNRAYIEKWRGRMVEEKYSSVKSDTKIKVPAIENNEQEVIGEGQSYTESERQLKYLDTLKRQKEIEKLDIDIAKKRGEVVPSELIKPVFLQHNQSILTEFKNTTDEIIRIFSKKKALSVEEMADVKGKCVESINRSIGKALAATEKAVDSIIQNHSESKGVGQHG